MKKSKVLDLKRFRFGDGFRKNGLFWFFAFLLALGFLLGTLLSGNSVTLTETVRKSLHRYAALHIRGGFSRIFVSVLLTKLAVLLFFFLCGTTMLGIVLAPMLLCYHGFMFGSAAAYLYAAFGVEGIAFYAVLLVPPFVPFFICLILGCREAFRFSNLLAKLTFPHSPSALLYPEFRNYSRYFLVLVLPLLLSAVLDGVLSCAFYRSFALNL
ncbi:MAG: hypothetical protein MJ132_08745 [Clostridia bacterium]|nr:hypothetical protein [Clostridia bacterium]